MRDAIISIKSIQTSGEETDTTEIITEGQYVLSLIHISEPTRH